MYAYMYVINLFIFNLAIYHQRGDGRLQFFFSFGGRDMDHCFWYNDMISNTTTYNNHTRRQIHMIAFLFYQAFKGSQWICCNQIHDSCVAHPHFLSRKNTVIYDTACMLIFLKSFPSSISQVSSTGCILWWLQNPILL